MTTEVAITGTFVSDNGTILPTLNEGNPLTGTFTFTNSTPFIREHIVAGCYRPPTFPWYLQPFPWWTQFIIVPLFSILSSLANLQPFWTWDLVVMVVLSCVSYAANKIANHFIFNHSDIVSAIGAFAVGLLGNIYSRKMGGTAFTAMVTGVLFLVPVSSPLLPLSVLFVSLKTVTVRFIASRRYHGTRLRHRYRKRDDSSYHWYHCRTLYESSYRLHVRFSEERRCFLILIGVILCILRGRLIRTLYFSRSVSYIEYTQRRWTLEQNSMYAITKNTLFHHSCLSD